jgi:negative regulator of flagellin synthesis FlgM
MEITGKKLFARLDRCITEPLDRKKTEVASEKSSTGPLEEDKVVLSPRAREIQEAKKALSALPDVREEKIAEIRKKIESGVYRIEGDKIAVQMLKTAFEEDLI